MFPEGSPVDRYLRTVRFDILPTMRFSPSHPRLAGAAFVRRDGRRASCAVFLAALAGSLAFGSFGCGLGGGEAEAEPSFAVTVEIAEVKSGPLRDIATFSGQLDAEQSVMVKAEDDGVIAGILFEEGQEVEEGKILFRLRDGEQKARLAEARATLRLAKEVHARTENLATRAAISQAARDEAAAELAVARARVEVADVALERTRVRAPFGGVVGQRLVAPGDRVDENVALVQLDAVDRLQVQYGITELGILFTKVGAPVALRVGPYPGETFPGEVFFVSPTLDPNTRRIVAKAWIDNRDRRLRAGLFAEIDMQVAERENAILVPEAAVVFDRHGTYVWRVDAGMKVAKVPVETGLRRDGEVEVTLGLQPGDRIVSAGVNKLDEGDEVVAAAPLPAASGQARGDAPADAGDGA